MNNDISPWAGIRKLPYSAKFLRAVNFADFVIFLKNRKNYFRESKIIKAQDGRYKFMKIKSTKEIFGQIREIKLKWSSYNLHGCI